MICGRYDFPELVAPNFEQTHYFNFIQLTTIHCAVNQL
jgi:hypothetical protein